MRLRALARYSCMRCCLDASPPNGLSLSCWCNLYRIVIVATRTMSRFRTIASSTELTSSAARIRCTKSECSGIKFVDSIAWAREKVSSTQSTKPRETSPTHLEGLLELTVLVRRQGLLQPHQRLARLSPLPRHLAAHARAPVIVLEDAPRNLRHVLLPRRHPDRLSRETPQRSRRRRRRRPRERVAEFDVEDRNHGVVLFREVVQEDRLAEPLLDVGAFGGGFDNVEQVRPRVGEVQELQVALDLTGLRV